MLSIDCLFNQLTNEIERMSLLEVFEHIRAGYLNILPATQKGLEDFFAKFPYWGQLKKDEGIFDELYNRAKTLKIHLSDLVWLYTKLKDYRSKKALYAILNNWFNFDFKTLNIVRENNFSHYFDLDILSCDNQEVFVDVGAYTGDTIKDYLNDYGIANYHKIIAYEITPHIANVLTNSMALYPNIEIRNKGVLDHQTVAYVNESPVDASANTLTNSGTKEVPITTLDEDIKEPITLIKMDIEGSEELALMGAKEHIIKEKPKLAISIYHGHDALWQLPLLINQYRPDYQFYIRYYGNNIFPTEIVLLAK